MEIGPTLYLVRYNNHFVIQDDDSKTTVKDVDFLSTLLVLA